MAIRRRQSKRNVLKSNTRHRKLRFEKFEDRCMLATMADIVFVVDESGSDQNTHSQQWITELVTGAGETLSLAEHFEALGIDDVRYGLIGFGEGVGPPNFETPRFAHSQLMVPGVSTSLFIDPAGADGNLGTPDDVNFATIFSNLVQQGAGPTEDGWDALEHVIAEYDFRDEAVPIVVLVQGDEGRRDLNNNLTHDGVLASLDSKSVILNTIVAGELLVNGEPLGPGDPNPGEPLDTPAGAEFDWAQIFDLASYEGTVTSTMGDLYVLGVEADQADGLGDGRHGFHWVDTEPGPGFTLPGYTFSDTLQISHDGSNTGATGMVGSGKSILLGPHVTGGFGYFGAGGYRARSEALTPVDMTGATEVFPGNSIAYDFTFFETDHNQVFANEDGTISFNAAMFDPTNVDLSFAEATDIRPTEPMIAALWNNLRGASSDGLNGRILQKTGNFDSDATTDLALQWTDYRYADDSNNELTGDPISFQAVLYGNGNIRFNYLDLDSYPNNEGDVTQKVTGGIDATVGLWTGSALSLYVPKVDSFIPGLHSITTDSAGETADSYIRMAWDTGGAAWDLGVIDRFYADGGVHSPEADALRDALIESMGEQILRADAAGKTFQVDNVVLALNLGVGTGIVEGFAPDDGTHTADVSTAFVTATVPLSSFEFTSNSVPSGVQEVFRSARTAEAGQDDVHVSIDTLDGTNPMVDGTYIVELLFAQIGGVLSPTFDVLLEGQTMLNDYSIASDQAAIDAAFETGIENDVEPLGTNHGIVKRFAVDVTGGDLQIDLLSENGQPPQLNGVRILSTQPDAPLAPPQVVDVVLASSAFSPSYGDYAFSSPLDNSQSQFSSSSAQIVSVPLGAVDELSVRFSRDVQIVAGDLGLIGMRTALLPAPAMTDPFVYDETTFTATWRFASPLVEEHYLLRLTSSVKSVDHNVALDGEWVNPLSRVAAGAPSGYESISTFPSGDGVAGGQFAFVFTVLPGDMNGDNKITSVDAAMVTQAINSGAVYKQDTLADVNNNGVLSSSDITYFNNVQLPAAWDLRTVYLAGDFSSNDSPTGGEYVVDGNDNVIINSSYGQTVIPFTEGDANGDGIVDDDDWDIFTAQLGYSFVGWRPLGARR